MNIIEGNYIAKDYAKNTVIEVKENETVYYSFGPKNTVSESMYRVKSSESNITFIGLDQFNVTVVSEAGVTYFDITLGGSFNPSLCIFGVKTTDNSSANLSFTLETRELTVAGDKIGLGSNTVEVLKGSYVKCTYKVTNAGNYTVTSEEENAWFVKGSDFYGGDFGEINFTFECAVNDVITFEIYTINNESDFITFNLVKGSSLKVGINSIEVAAWETLEEEFIPTEDGTYRFTPLDSNSVIGYSEGGITFFFPNEDDGEYFEKELEAGKLFTVLVSTANYKKGTVRFSIAKV